MATAAGAFTRKSHRHEPWVTTQPPATGATNRPHHYVHTGGIPGIFAYPETFSRLSGEEAIAEV